MPSLLLIRASCLLTVQMVDDHDGGAERIVVKSPGAAVRVEISSSTGVISVYQDGSQEPLVSRSSYIQLTFDASHRLNISPHVSWHRTRCAARRMWYAAKAGATERWRSALPAHPRTPTIVESSLMCSIGTAGCGHGAVLLPGAHGQRPRRLQRHQPRCQVGLQAALARQEVASGRRVEAQPWEDSRLKRQGLSLLRVPGSV